MAPKRRRRSPRQRQRCSEDDTKEAPKRKRACQRQRRSQDVVKPKNDARKQLLLDSVKGQRRITRQNVSNTKQKISQMSDRELRMIQRRKRTSTPSPSKHSTNIATDGSTGTVDKTDNADEIVPSPVESPKTNDKPSFSSRQSNETTSNNVASKKVRHASKAALEAIGKIARFERMKEKSAVPNILDEISIDSEFSVSVYRPPPPSQHSTVETNKSTIFSDDDTNKSPVLQQIAIPELPKMLTTKVSMDHFVDDDTITEISGMQSNENPENSFLNIDTNSTNKTILHSEKDNNTSPPCDDEHVHDNRTQKSHKVSGKYSSLLLNRKKKKKRLSLQRKYLILVT